MKIFPILLLAIAPFALWSQCQAVLSDFMCNESDSTISFNLTITENDVPVIANNGSDAISFSTSSSGFFFQSFSSSPGSGNPISNVPFTNVSLINNNGCADLLAGKGEIDISYSDCSNPIPFTIEPKCVATIDNFTCDNDYGDISFNLSITNSGVPDTLREDSSGDILQFKNRDGDPLFDINPTYYDHDVAVTDLKFEYGELEAGIDCYDLYGDTLLMYTEGESFKGCNTMAVVIPYPTVPFGSSNEVRFSDPCYCENPLNNFSGTTKYFHDSLTVDVTGLTGPITGVTLESSTNFYSDDSGTPHVMGATFVETSPGIYKLEFWSESGIQPTVTVNIGTNAGPLIIPVPSSDLSVCNYSDCQSANIPTLSEWGLILLLLSMMSVSIVAIRQHSLFRVH